VKNTKHRIFVERYLKTFNATEATIAAGYSKKTARQQGSRLLSNVDIAEEIKGRVQRKCAEFDIDPSDLIQEWTEIVTTDFNQLVSYQRYCCPYCWGKGFRRQHTPESLEAEQERHERNRATIATHTGTDIGPYPAYEDSWWDQSRQPNPNCPNCRGLGIGRPVIHDTTALTPEASRCYLGVVVKDGHVTEVKLPDKARALENLADALGMFPRRTSQVAERQPKRFTDDDAMVFWNLLEKARRQTVIKAGD